DLVKLVVSRTYVNRFPQRHVDDLVALGVKADDLVADALPAFHYHLARTEKPEQSGQVVILVGGRVLVCFDRVIDARAEHLLGERSGHMDGRDVINVWLQAKLREQRQRDLLDMHQIVERILRISLVRRVEITGHSDLSDAINETLRLDALLHFWEAGDAFFRCPRHGIEKTLFVRASANTFLITPAASLVNENDTVLRSLVDRTTRAGRQASGVGTVITDTSQIVEPCHIMCTDQTGTTIYAARAIVFADIWI